MILYKKQPEEKLEFYLESINKIYKDELISKEKLKKAKKDTVELINLALEYSPENIHFMIKLIHDTYNYVKYIEIKNEKDLYKYVNEEDVLIIEGFRSKEPSYLMFYSESWINHYYFEPLDALKKDDFLTILLKFVSVIIFILSLINLGIFYYFLLSGNEKGAEYCFYNLLVLISSSLISFLLALLNRYISIHFSRVRLKENNVNSYGNSYGIQ